MIDLVEREAIKDAIGFMNLHFLGHGENKSLLDSINEVPSVDAVPVVHGRWNTKPYYKADGKGGVFKYCDFYLCSECATERPIVPPYNYCPNCGAKMDLEVDNA